MVLTPPCPFSQGDLKRYLRAQRPPEGLSPELPPRDLRTLQRMGLEIARGLAHLHSHNYVHRWQLGRSVCGGHYLL